MIINKGRKKIFITILGIIGILFCVLVFRKPIMNTLNVVTGGRLFDTPSSALSSLYFEDYEGTDFISYITDGKTAAYEYDSSSNTYYVGDAEGYEFYIFDDDDEVQLKYTTEDSSATVTGDTGKIAVCSDESGCTLSLTVSRSGVADTHYEITYYPELDLTGTGTVNTIDDIENYFTEYVVPRTGTYKIEAWGASGGSGCILSGTTCSTTYAGGYGAYTSGTINLKGGTVLYVYVGQAGASGNKISGTFLAGGNPGGGSALKSSTDSNYVSGAGGGATDIRTKGTVSSGTDETSLASRIMVAAGGAGGSYNETTASWSTNGGGLYVDGLSTTYCSANQSDGFAFGVGSTANQTSIPIGGGGGGWYGGYGYVHSSGASATGGSGCGGSSYISGHLGSIGVTSAGVSNKVGATTSDDITDSFSNTGYVFTNTTMIDGFGYTWTTKPSESYTGMVSPKGNTVQGNLGGGHVRITQIAKASKVSNKLTGINTSAGSISPVFDPDTFDYELDLDTFTNSVSIEGTIADPSLTDVTDVSTYTLEVGSDKYALIFVTDKATNAVNTYTIHIKRATLPAGQHTTLIEKIDYANHDTIYFNASQKVYSLPVSYGKMSVDLKIQLYDTDATYTISGNTFMLNDTGTITIIVTDSNASPTSTEYTLNYTRETAAGDVEDEYIYYYTGTYQTFTAPISGDYKVELWGASGGTMESGWTGVGGNGAYTTGVINLTKDTNLYVYVGSKGVGYNNNISTKSGGWNGGGTQYSGASGGGGATDIRLLNGSSSTIWSDSKSLNSRIMVAAGGGGSNDSTNGGYGGDLTGGTGQNGSNSNGAGATQLAGGAGSSYGVFGAGGGALEVDTADGGAGGGGYYGGGKASGYNTAGGGGSSYISGYLGSIAVSSASVSSARKDSEGTTCTLATASVDETCSYHYSGYKFTETQMIAGNATQPTLDGEDVQSGNNGNGYAKITPLSNKSENNFLSDLTFDVGTRDPVLFDPITYDYTITVNIYTQYINLEGIPYDSTATVEGDGEHLLEVGENDYPVVVTAENGEIRTYNVKVIREGLKGQHSNQINRIYIDDFGYIYPTQYDYEYDFELGYNKYDAKMTVTLYDSDATYTISGNELIVANSGKITITVKHEDGRIPDVEYTLNYTRELPLYEPEGTYMFECTKTEESFVAPLTGSYILETWGASGGGATTDYYSASHGGRGGYASGTILLKKGEEIYINVGCAGTYAYGLGQGAGWNGGGAGGGGGYGGGGGTDIRYKGDVLAKRILVAGGGGGADNGGGAYLGGDDGSGGVGGGTTGENAKINGSYQPNTGATETTGYQLGVGQSATVNTDTGGAGGGYYGGFVTNNNNGGAGGGSGFVNTEILSDTKLFSGASSFPSTDGETYVFGNDGDGHAKITVNSYLSENNYLESITTDIGTWDQTYDPAIKTYTVTVGTYDTYVEISATAYDTTHAVIKGTGTKELDMGKNDFDITVTAQDGSVRTYTITVVRPQITDGSHTAELQKIKFDGLDPILCEPGVYEYEIEIPETWFYLDVTPIAYDATSKQSLKGFSYIPSDQTATITSRVSGQRTINYKIKIIKGDVDTIFTYDFECTQDYQEFTAPIKGYYTFQLWGAEGGTRGTNNAGKGGYATGRLLLQKGQTVYVYVGCSGDSGGTNGGWNGGGSRARFAGGGGASDVRTEIGDLYTRFIVAGGGGSVGASWAYGGAGGGLAGGSAYSGCGCVGYGGTQTAGGGGCAGNSGTFGIGGYGAYWANGYAGAGGGGWYGGSGAYPDYSVDDDKGGGGGSSFILSADSVGNTPVGYKLSSDYFLKDTDTIAGGSEMPSPYSNNTNIYGKTGNGFVRIKLSVLSDDNFLSKLIIKSDEEDVAYTPVFNVQTQNYTVNLDTNQTTVEIQARPEDSTATITGLGEYEIPIGKTTIPITVTSESGKDRIYEIEFNREGSSESTPTNIKISGLLENYCSKDELYCKLSPNDFDPDTNSYTMTVPYKVKQLNFDVIKANSNQVVNGDGTVTLNDVTTNVTIEVQSETCAAAGDLISAGCVSTYAYSITRDLAGDADIASLKITDPKDKDLLFDSDIVEYRIAVPYENTSLGLEYTLDSKDATAVVKYNENFQIGWNVVNIVVTAMDGTVKTYTINVYREKEDSTFLSGISVTGTDPTNSVVRAYSITPDFDKLNTGYYEVIIPNDLTELDISGSPESANSTVSYSCSGGSTTITEAGHMSNIPTGYSFAYITVTAQDGSSDTYKIRIFREKNSNSLLDSLSVTDSDDNTLIYDPSFQSNVLEYKLSVDVGVSTLKITGVPQETTSRVSISTMSLVPGTNTISITVTAEDGSQTVYKLIVYRPPSTNNKLDTLKIEKPSGTDWAEIVYSPLFDPDVTEYSVSVPNDVTSVRVSGTISDELATIQNNNGIHGLAVGDNKILFVVASEAGETRTYTITVTRAANSNAFLKSATTSNGETVVMTDHSIRTYNINVANSVETLSFVSAIPEASTTTWKWEQISPNTDGNLSTTETNVFKVTSTAEDGTEIEYTINVIRDKSDNTNLEWLALHEGAISPSFDKYTTTYDAKVTNEITAGTIDAIAEDTKSTVTISDNINNLVEGLNVVTITVTSESNVSKVYTINITKQALEQENNHLFSLKVDKGTLVPAFTPNNMYYEVELDYGYNEITVSADPYDTSGATVTGIGKYTLGVGRNLIVVKVISADGIERDYQILVKRKESDEARLKELIIDGALLNPAFDSDTYFYTVITQEKLLDIKKITPIEDNATYVVIGNNFPAITGTYSVIIRVTAPDKVTTKEYEIQVKKEASKNAYLSSLEVEGYTLSPPFDKTTTVYEVLVPEGVMSVNIKATAENPEASITGLGILTLSSGATTTVVTVTSGSGDTFEYTIKIKRTVSNNSLLEKLGLKNGVLNITFDPNTLEYIGTVPYGTRPDLFYKAQSSTATVTVTSTEELYQQSPTEKFICTYTITVTAEDGTQTVYKLKVKEASIVSSLLSNIEVDKYLLNPSFDSSVTDYYVYQNNEDTTITLDKITTLDPNAKINIRCTTDSSTTSYTGTGEVDSVTFNDMSTDDKIYDIVITVTSSDGSTSQDYTVHVYHQPYADNFLSYIYYFLPQKGTEIYYPTPTFDKYTLEYYVDVPNEITTLDLHSSHVNGLTVTGEQTYNLSTGLNTLSLTVKKDNTQRTYIVYVTRALNSNSKISNISLRNGSKEYSNSLSPVFDEDTLSYVVTVDPGTEYLDVTATIAGTSTITGDGKNLTPIGTTTIELIVTAEDGTTSTYYINVIRNASTDNKLIDLSPSSGSLDPGFTPDTLTYDLVLPSGVGSLSFTAKTSDGTATISGLDTAVVPDGNSVRTISVMSESGAEVIYTINIYKYSSNNVYLSSLEYNTYTLTPTFDKDTDIYTVIVPNSVRTISSSDVRAIPEDSSATVSKSATVDLSTTAYKDYSILVTGGDGTTTKTYHLQIIREQGSTSTLSGLTTTTGYLVEKFSPTTLKYTYMIPTTQTTVDLSNFVYKTTDEKATVLGDATVDLTTATLPMTYNIRVISEDMTSFTDYEITLKWDFNSVNTLATLSVQNGYMVETFKTGLYTYNVYEYETTPSDVVSATTTSDKAQIISGLGAVDLTQGPLFTHYVIVQAEDGTQLQYKIIFHNTYKTDENLEAFALEGLSALNCDEDECALSPAFDGNIIEYDIAVPYDYVLLDWYYQTMNTEQTVVFRIGTTTIKDQTYKLPIGTTKLEIDVYDGLKNLTKTYTVNIERHKSDNANLSKLVISNTTGTYKYPLTPEFASDIYEYQVEVDHDVDEVLMSATQSDPNAKVKFNGYNYLQDGDNLATATVTAADGTVKTYVVHIIKEPLNNSWLKQITVSTGTFHELSPTFMKTTKNYTVTLSGEYDEITIDALPDKTTTTVRGTGTFPIGLGMNVFTLTGTATDGSTTVYTIGIIQEAADVVDLAKLELKGVDLNPEFDPTVIHYTATVEDTVEGIDVTAIPQDPRASVYVTGNETLVTGLNIISVQVISQSKANSKTYQINVTRPLSSNAYLSELDVYSIDSDSNKTYYETSPKEFDSQVFDYTVTVPYDISSVFLEATKQASTSKISGSGYYSINYGHNPVTITVKSEDDTVTKTYNVDIIREYNLYLEKIEYSAGTLSPSFDRKTKSYTLTVPNTTKRVYIRGTAEDPTTVQVSGNSTYPSTTTELSTTSNTTASLVLTADDGTTDTYTVEIVRQKNANAYAQMISVGEGALTTKFVENSSGPYELHVRKSDCLGKGATFNIIPKVATTTTKEIIGNSNFVVGENDVTVRMVAEDGETTFDYDFKIYVEEDSYFSNTLTSLSVIYPNDETYSIELTPTFKSDVNSYSASVANSVDNVEILVSAPSNATVSGDSGSQTLAIGRNQFTIKVTGIDGVENDYQLVIYRLDDNANLASLIVEGHPFVFAQDTEDYSIDVGDDEETLNVTATPVDPNSTVDIVGTRHLTTGFNYVIITVYSPGGATRTYRIVAKKAVSSNPYLESLEVVGYTYSPKYDKTATQTYQLTVDSDVNSVVIKGTPEKTGTTCTNLGTTLLSFGENRVDILCTAGDLITTHQYTLSITRTASSNNKLATLSVSPGSLNETFNKDLNEYTVTLGQYDGRYITITGTADDSNSTVDGIGQYFLAETTTTIPITVTAQDGSKNTYKVTVTVWEDTSPTLSTLYVEEGPISPTFNKTVTTYYVHVPYEVTDATVKYNTTSDSATVHVSGNNDLIIGTNEVTVTVLSSDGSQTMDYVIYVIRDPYASNLLSSIKVKDTSNNSYSLTPTFDPAHLYYEVTVPYNVDKVKVSGNVQDTTATLSGAKTYDLNEGQNWIYLMVTSASNYVRTYTIVVTRQSAASTTNLSYLTSLTEDYDGADLVPAFDPSITTYTLKVSSETSTIKLDGTAATGASVVGFGKSLLKYGTNQRTIKVTGSDGTETDYYVNITRPYTDYTAVDNIVPSVGVLNYVDGVTEYDMDVEATVASISFEVTTKDPLASVTGNEETPLVSGKNIITITITGTNGEEKVIHIFINKSTAVTGIELEEHSIILGVGEQISVDYDFDPSDTTYTDVTWSIDSEDYATIAANGLITGKSPGTATVTITSDFDSSVKDTLTVKVIYKEIKVKATSGYEVGKKDTTKGYETNYVYKADVGATIADYMKQFMNDAEYMHIYDPTGAEVSKTSTDVLPTGYTVKLIVNDKVLDEAKVIMMGDINGDAYITAVDVQKAKLGIANLTNMTWYGQIAADINYDGYITAVDLSQIKLLI